MIQLDRKRCCSFISFTVAALLNVCSAAAAGVTSSIIPDTLPAVSCPEPGSVSHGWRQFSATGVFPVGSVIDYHCLANYSLKGSNSQVCTKTGEWMPLAKPTCEPDFHKCRVPLIIQGKVRARSNGYAPRDKALIDCLPDHKINSSSAYITCQTDGQWTDSTGSNQMPICIRSRCAMPPQIPNGNWVSFYGPDVSVQAEGSKVIYHCDSGYRMPLEIAGFSQVLSCTTGHWEGTIPSCLRTIQCYIPSDIEHGHWEAILAVGLTNSNPHGFELGTKVEYRCDEGYKILGENLIVCKAENQWSHEHPLCIPENDASMYCPTPANPPHGYCDCSGHDPSYCEPFIPGLQLVCQCKAGYTVQGPVRLTCREDGLWTSEVPTCVQAIETNEIVPLATDHPDASSDHLHVSTLAIVIATACSVLGILLLIMVAVVFRRQKPRPSIYNTSHVHAPPPYTRVENSATDDQDRLALISCIENAQLPSYVEATCSPSPCSISISSRGSSNISAMMHRSSDASAMTEYHHLPPVASVLRGYNQHQNTPLHASDRHSTSTAPRGDGISEIFGSVDTVNVSMSDASTSITVETLDSATSNPSIGSRRANAGSFNSSSGSLAPEDAPLLDRNHASHSEGRASLANSEQPTEEVKEE